MILSKLLALTGTGLLFCAMSAAAYWALEVIQSQPPLPSMPEPSTAAPARSPVATYTGRRARPDVYFAAITQRPLFNPTRRPIESLAPAPRPEPVVELPEETIEQPVQQPPPDLRLLGMIGSSDGASALLSNRGGEPDWLSEESQIDGWTITEIGPDWIELTLGQQKIRFEMYDQ